MEPVFKPDILEAIQSPSPTIIYNGYSTMKKPKADLKPDMKLASDRGENITLMEPLVIGDAARARSELTDLALELAQRSSGFYRSLPTSMVASFANMVRAMNCYYSNLIEGHDTHPIEIERALKNDWFEVIETCQVDGETAGLAGY